MNQRMGGRNFFKLAFSAILATATLCGQAHAQNSKRTVSTSTNGFAYNVPHSEAKRVHEWAVKQCDRHFEKVLVLNADSIKQSSLRAEINRSIKAMYPKESPEKQSLLTDLGVRSYMSEFQRLQSRAK